MGTNMVNTKTLAILIGLGGLFGGAFFYMKVLVEEIAPMEIVAGRLVIGSPVVFAIMAARGIGFRLNPAMLAKISLLALLDTVIPYTLIAWAEVRIDSGVVL